ncbi:hypothetical protein PHYPSEUDO_014770 [Phytophthora pseudosyringae]|uniref:Amino acid transporter transmembrane domain-containing protein n=1 Tax=Phytophthora pseudosyringae TaxID=221518 RepID=A0A8T1V7A2_9STRA|nr:hypothetical protein PHYPSEUDO_014770 [Phytophthora pseudosyringae]
MIRSAFFTIENAKIAFNLCCGVGTLGMPGNFSRAGPAIAIVALLFTAFANVYASVGVSKVMLLAPRTGPRSSKHFMASVVSMADIENDDANEESEAAEYRGANSIKYVVLRIAIVALQVLASVLLKDHFSDLSGFVGSSAITMSGIILPIAFYLKRCWDQFLFTRSKGPFAPSESEINFPFCAPEYQKVVYFNYTAQHEM